LQIVSEATHIVHTAWPVTFTYHFQSFVPHLAGLRVLIDIALASPRPAPPSITFISSISVAGRPSSLLTSDAAAMLPEASLTSVAQTLPHGYAQSKYAAERILEKAAQATPLHVAIVRSGQISGSVKTGAWNANEYIPCVLRASVRVGKVPDDLAIRVCFFISLF
jgi:thioester reductase-like protein